MRDSINLLSLTEILRYQNVRYLDKLTQRSANHYHSVEQNYKLLLYLRLEFTINFICWGNSSCMQRDTCLKPQQLQYEILWQF